MKKTILFDLDGTIINSQLGVTRCVQHALKHFNIIEEDLEKLRVFIGPPLSLQFKALYQMSDLDTEIAIEKYRERYHDIGIHECELYQGVKETLDKLKEKDYKICIASSKPEPACEFILKKYNIAHYFDVIGGATFDGRITTKVQVLEDVIHRLNIKNREEIILIGDTKYDVEGANEAKIDCIGITYGFGTREELLKAGAIYVCDTLMEAVNYIEADKFN